MQFNLQSSIKAAIVSIILINYVNRSKPIKIQIKNKKDRKGEMKWNEKTHKIEHIFLKIYKI